MPATPTSRIDGMTTSVAVKPPCVVATVAAITLSGEQTVNGVAVTEGDRVLVKDQASSVNNGIYVVSTGDWTRARDFDGARDAVEGTLVIVVSSTGDGICYRVTTPSSPDNPIVFGTSAITFIETLFGSSSAIAFLQSGTGAVTRSVQGKGRDIFDVRDFNIVGDGVTDDTTAVQQAITAAGANTLNFGPNTLTLLISASLTGVSGAHYTGRAKIKAKANSIAGAMLDLSNCSNVLVDGLEFDANAANTGAHHGIQLLNGTNNIVQNCYIHDTLETGVRAGSENGSRILGNYLLNCGRNTFTDNHGAFFYSTTATACKNCVIAGNFVDTAYRKGVGTYSAAPGTVIGIVIANNTITGCGLAGIYCANLAGAAAQRGITVSGNYCFNNYSSILMANIQGGACNGNTSDTSTVQGIYLTDIVGVTVAGNEVTGAGASGIVLLASALTPKGNNITGNTCLYNNTSGTANEAGIKVDSCTYTRVADNTILISTTATTAAKEVFGILESGTADYNVLVGNLISTAAASRMVFVGAHTRANDGLTGWDSSTAASNNFTIPGGISRLDQAVALGSTANNDLALPSSAGTICITAPAGAPWDISGIAGGVQGRELRIVNFSGQTGTFLYNSTRSTTGNRFVFGGAASRSLSNGGSMDLTWLGTQNFWFGTGVTT